MVSEAFREHRWKVASIDIDPDSNASIKRDILNVEPYELPFVPDFIWSSLPCETYSKLNGGKDRVLTNFDKTERALEHNDMLLKTFEILQWAKWYAPHLIVVIENPVGLLKKTPRKYLPLRMLCCATYCHCCHVLPYTCFSL